ncbi:MAG: hypothetical protein Q8L01_03670 [Candidatus Woesebacteria bacterium]|nr:hypothetical protein [Candidatus Woesebacteria bacterium]
MKTLESYQEIFYTGGKSDKVKYSINDSVEKTSGKLYGIIAAVISLNSIDPEVVYSVENGKTGEIVEVHQFNLKPFIK